MYELKYWVAELTVAQAFTAAGQVEWITLVISPQWIFQKRSITTTTTLIVDGWHSFMSTLKEKDRGTSVKNGSQRFLFADQPQH